MHTGTTQLMIFRGWLDSLRLTSEGKDEPEERRILSAMSLDIHSPLFTGVKVVQQAGPSNFLLHLLHTCRGQEPSRGLSSSSSVPLLCSITELLCSPANHLPFGESLAVRAVTVGTTEVSGVCCDGRYCMYRRWACMHVCVCVCTVFKW